MEKFIVISILLFTFSLANANMVLNDSIGNDPAKEKLCASRVKIINGKMVPFEIDADYVARIRSYHPDTSFVAIDDGSSPLLC